jgi:ABC-2 type transport system permease protein
MLGIESGVSGGLIGSFITLGVGGIVMLNAGAYFTAGLRKYESAGNCR